MFDESPLNCDLKKTDSRDSFDLRAMVATLVVVCALINVTWAGVNDGTQTQVRLDANTLSELIDSQIDLALNANGIAHSRSAADGEFIRRMYLDLYGVVPSPGEVVNFLDSSDPHKRANLIDAMLERPAYGEHMADLWTGWLMKGNPTMRGRNPRKPLFDWLADSFNDSVGWDRTTYELLTATGPQHLNAAVTPFMTYKGSLAPHEATNLVSRLFLGVQLKCAQCHDHPFADWTHDQYWSLASFFKRVSRTYKWPNLPPEMRKPKGDPRIEGTHHGIIETRKRRKRPDLDRSKNLPPRFLTGEQPRLDPRVLALRPMLAEWITAPENPWFAPAMVNRLWAQLFGRGLVNPIDDLREDNPASHPELLHTLSEQFIAHHFDVKYLIHAICNTRAYQRSSIPQSEQEDDAELYSHMTVKVMSPRQLFDTLEFILGSDVMYRRGKRTKYRNQFIDFFQTDEEPDPTAYRRGIPQLLKIMNDPKYQAGMARRAAQPAASGSPPAQIIDELYLVTLSRRPNDNERERMLAFARRYSQQPARAYTGKGYTGKGYTGILWALINSSEFTLNH